MSSITKNTLAKTILYETGIPVSIAEDIVDDIFTSIIDGSAKDDSVKIANFGSFSVKNKKSRMGRNLNTHEDVMIKPRKVVGFQASAKLKQAINES
ncbi:MAG: HU family DNA-binding protein [Rickettsiales bacterium]|jgi:integration host factor subunit alpha|nr:HU family DNA-binding protein [Rickettsiales bacterium]